MKYNNFIKTNKEIIIIIILLFILFLLTFLLKNKNNKIKKPENIPDVKWPFLNLKDENGKNINMLVVRAYFGTTNPVKKDLEDFKKYVNQGIKFIGCSSHLSYPRVCNNPHGKCNKEKNFKEENIKIDGKNIEDCVLGWCHCFREPKNYIMGDVPKLLLSESDFINDKIIKPNKYIKIKYDYICFQPKDNKCNIGWNGHNKNWILAKKCIQIFSDELGLKGIIIGRGDCLVDINNKQNITVTDKLKYNDCLNKIKESKFMLLPNFEDASPRVITEALALNKPIFVYENILGGWKYVNDKTGIFFNENNIKIQVEKLLNNIKNNKYSPREYYINNYGLKNSGKIFKDFLKSIYPELSPCEYVKFNIS